MKERKQRLGRYAFLAWTGLLLLTTCGHGPVAPVAPQKPRELVAPHGHVRVDPYYWLNERDNPEVLAYLQSEQQYTEAMLAPVAELQDQLFTEITGRLQPQDESVPYLFNGYYHYTRYAEGREYPVYCRKAATPDAAEEVLLDVNQLAEGKNYCSVTGVSPSPDNRLISFGVDTVGRRKYEIRFKNVLTGENLTDTVGNTTGRTVWAEDSRTVFYTVKDHTLRSFQIMKHRLSGPAGEDEVVFHEDDPTFSVFVAKTKSRRFILVGSRSTLSTEYRYLDAAAPDGPLTVIQPRERNLEYHVDHAGDSFYIRTNLDAPNFRLMRAPLTAPGRENWTEVVPHRTDVLLTGLELFRDHLVLEERENGLTRLRIMNRADGTEHEVDFAEPAYVVRAADNHEFDTAILRFVYSSLTTPSSTYDYDMSTRRRTLRKQQPVRGDFSPANYATERLSASTRDEVKVPVSLVYRRDLRTEGPQPLLLYGYGSYGASMDPSFRAERLSLLDRGFIFAIAHIRGGQEMGRYWYEDGKLLKKKNTFTDFIDCAEYLAAQGYTAPDRLVAQGGSAGGLLMGAVVNMRPDLFRVVIAAVPFVDVVTTMLDDSIPLTTSEYDEWGNPADPVYYEYMLSYSPYDNVARQDYPAMLVTTGLHDSQVQYFEPAKWVARLRQLKTDDHPLLLDIDFEAGHGGTTGRFKRFRRTAREYAFLLDVLEMKR
ncbi:MAG: S9 family peptidase [Acidobacteria bacterium]|nr:S9 family peptidase [Acidobacteriota bacterium]